MSSNNPYAVNGYGSNNGNASNPYGAPSANPYGGSNRFNDPYLPQNNQSSTSVNSHGSRGERRPDERGLGRPPANPYEQRPPRRPSPGPPSASYDRSSDSLQTPTAIPGTDPRFGQGPRPQARGYGGLGPAPVTPVYDRQERQQTPPQRPRTAGRDQDRDRDRERDRDRDRERAYSDSRSRERRNAPDPRDMPPPPPIPAATTMQRQYSPRRPVKSMEEILRHIQRDWKNMEGDECVPIKVALQLMDPSSLGLGDREADFGETHVDLQRSLKKVVNEQYADFNSAVGTYHKIQACIRDSQSRVRYLKNGLMTTRGAMLTTKPELRGLAEQSGELDGLLSILTQMETLREMPSRLEERINEKRWISAIEVLTEALRSCRKSDLDGIGAMSDLRNYFSSQETSLVDLLVEELHDHLYLKSPYCVDRWKGRRADGGEKNAKETFGGNTWDRPVYAFLASLNTRNPMVENATKNPEADTFHYIHMLIESLNKLGYLEEVVTRIEQRMPVELYKVVERTNNEIDAKHPSHIRAQLQKGRASLRVPQPGDSRTQVLSEFLWTLYAKFEAIAEGHRVLHEVVTGIVQRENLSKPEKYTAGFKELWKLYQMEIRSLLHDYLAADGDFSLGKGVTTVSGTDIFAKHRDKNRKMFKLSNMTEKSADLKAEEQELEEILKNSVPGLVSKSRTEPGLSSSDRHGEDGTAAGHKLLIEPSVFNMTILLPPSLAFLQHLKDIVPLNSNIPISTLSSFLDDFLINVFHPQLEEAVTELCSQCMMDIEANTEDRQWAQYSAHPLFKGTTSFMALIRAFSEMLSSIPQDQMFTQLIITQLVAYYAKCFSYYTSMVSRMSASPTNPNVSTSTLKPAAALADSGELHDVVVDLFSSEEDRKKQKELNKKAVQLLLASTKATPLSAYDIISDPKSVYHLSLLYNSMQWLASSLALLRHIESSAPSRKAAHSRNSSQTNHMNVRRWTLITTLQTPSLKTGSDQISSVYLPLTSETVIPFDKTMQSFKELAEQSLLTLYLDVRLGVVHQLSRALRPVGPEGAVGPESPTPAVRASSTSLATESPPSLNSGAYPFVLPSPPTSASPRILELNNDLISFDVNISVYLGTKERKFILTGLGSLVDRYLIVGADHIQVMNTEGAERMRVDAMVIQQVLRGLGVSHKKSATTLSDNDDKTASNGVGLGISASANSSSSPNQEDAIEEDNLLTASGQYYELFLRGPEAIMRSVKDRKDAKVAPSQADFPFTYDELRTLIELCFSAAIRSEDREESIRARRKMDDLLLQLGEVMWDS